ncbi:hypothetical protein HDF16_003449 [Granulicella aggregans]|uniref:Uncharacterized protein n=1 Tax=Granulicella aggregans TaxID=474949 RepID=A0A7W7ZF09_9BACT|nr:hypothetical protein [Granulicella aggregans]MBB5058735.1 hypothetical protein [Granulicella aggregans]
MIFLGPRMARAYEYTLQYTAPSGARGVIVAGYAFANSTVSGVCSYYTSRYTGGRGGRTIITHYNNRCSWDFFGNLISTTPLTSGLTIPTVLSRVGYELIYAKEGASSTGFDTRGFGFVRTPSAHYSWEPPSGGYSDISDSVFTFVADLVSDGDYPLIIDKATVEAAITGRVTATAGTIKIVSDSCGRFLPVRSTCSVVVSYNPRTIACTTSPYGYAYTVADVALVTDAGANPSYKRGFTIYGVPVCGD